MDTVSLTIDGKTVTAEKGRTVLQAAIEAGIRVPYYCYHPGLGIDGSCRVCIVKIEKMPKLQTSCSTPVAEGMVVHTQTPDVVDARASVFEFLLINHPLDCPVCDKGGECPLQDFSYSFGPNESRMGFARRVFDGEGVKADVDFGPTLMLNRNRCILCTRCVRFMKEVDTDAQINITDRGYGSEIATFQEEGVHSILSGNLMDVCPVGAITTRDYRFKARPWDNPEAVDTICTLCEKGCNTTAWLKAKPEWAKGARLARMTPRFNPEVNGYWMCDIGRFNYHWVEGDERLTQPLVRSGARAGGSELEPGACDARRSACRRQRRTVGAAIPHLGACVARGAVGPRPAWRRVQSSRIRRRAQLADERQVTAGEGQVQGATRRCAERARRAGPRLPRQRQFHRRGRPLGLPRRRRGRPRDRRSMCSIPVRMDRLAMSRWVINARKSGTLPLLVVQGVLLTELAKAADVVLPGASWIEKDATYVNMDGRLQASARAMSSPGEAQEDWKILTDVGLALGAAIAYPSSAEIRTELAAAMAGNPTYANLTTITFARPVSARTWLQASNPSERWKWDFMFQDLPPVKFEGRHGLSSLLAAIPMKEVK